MSAQTVDNEPIIRCVVCQKPATFWLRNSAGRESLRCENHSAIALGGERLPIDPYDWHSLPDLPFR